MPVRKRLQSMAQAAGHLRQVVVQVKGQAALFFLQQFDALAFVQEQAKTVQPEDAAHPNAQFVDIKRFRDEIIGSGFDALQP